MSDDLCDTAKPPQPYRVGVVTRDMEQPAFPDRLLAAAADSGVDAATVGRHLPIVSRCVPDDDIPVLVARADRSDDRTCYLLVLTAHRLVITGETRVLRRRRLHLNADPRHLVDVLWTPEPALCALALSATVMDGVREHFWVRSPDPDAVDAALATVFRTAVVGSLNAAAMTAA
jgi:hypothetical protein